MVELKRQLKSIKYLFVVGYSFKDDHIAKIFKYASKTNRNLVLILVTPAAHEIYYFTLKRLIDEEFNHGYMHEGFDGGGFDVDLLSELAAIENLDSIEEEIETSSNHFKPKPGKTYVIKLNPEKDKHRFGKDNKRRNRRKLASAKLVKYPYLFINYPVIYRQRIKCFESNI